MDKNKESKKNKSRFFVKKTKPGNAALKKKIKNIFKEYIPKHNNKSNDLCSDNSFEDYENDDQFDIYSWNDDPGGSKLEIKKTDSNVKSDASKKTSRKKNKKLKKEPSKKSNVNEKDVEHVDVDEDNFKMLETISNIINCDQFEQNDKPLIVEIVKSNKKIKIKKANGDNPMAKADGDFKVDNVTEIDESLMDDTILTDSTMDSVESYNNDSINSFDFDVDGQLANNIRMQIMKKKHGNVHNSESVISFGNICFNVSSRKKEDKIEYINSAVEVLRQPLININNITSSLDSFKKSDELNTDIKVDQLLELDSSEYIIKTHYRIFTFSEFCIAALQEQSKVYFCGKLKASLLYGNVEVFGVPLTETPQELYSLNNSSLMCFETHTNDGPSHDLVEKLQNLNVPSGIVIEILNHVAEKDAILLLKPCNSPTLDFINKYLPDLKLVPKNINKKCNFLNDAYEILQCNFYDEGHAGIFVKNSVWDEITNSIFKADVNALSITYTYVSLR